MTAARSTYQAFVALCLLGPQLLACAHADVPTSATSRSAKKARPLVSLYAVTLGHVLGSHASGGKQTSPDTSTAPASPRAATIENFNSEEIFRTVDDNELEATLERLIDDQLVQFNLQGNWKLECQLKRYRTPDRDREVGMNIGLRYRFR